MINKDTILNQIQELKKPLKEYIEEQKTRRLGVLPTEKIIRHEDSSTGIHIRDDGVEIFSEASSLLLTNDGGFYINGNNINIVGSCMNTDMTDPLPSAINSKPFNTDVINGVELLELDNPSLYLYYSESPGPITDVSQLKKISIKDLFNTIRVFEDSQKRQGIIDGLV